MKWEIKPLKGAGPLTFGMEEEQVNSILRVTNQSIQRITEDDGSYSLHRGAANPSCYFTPQGKLKGISLANQIKDVFIEERNLFGSDPKDLLIFLQKLNGGVVKYAFWKVLLNELSLLLNGFYFGGHKFHPSSANDRNDERGIGIFVKEEFDPVISHFEDLKLK